MAIETRSDVVVVIERDSDIDIEPVIEQLRGILADAGRTLHRLVVVDCSDPRFSEAFRLRAFIASEPQVQHVRGVKSVSPAHLWNLGMQACTASCDIAWLDLFTGVSRGWLDELAAVAYSEERVICATPVAVSRDDGNWPVLDQAKIRSIVSNLPCSLGVPAPISSCGYLRSGLFAAVGLLDETFASFEAALMDWVMRAQALGFHVKRSNHAFHWPIKPDWQAPHPPHDDERGLLARRYPQLQPQLDRFEASLDRAVVERALRLASTGRPRVAYDLRSLPLEQVGTRTYAVSLVKAVAAIDEVDLTLLVKDQRQADGLDGRVVTEQNWKADVDVIHRPSQIGGIRELSLLYGSAAHLIVTYQDLIGYRIPQVFSDDTIYRDYQSISRISLQGAQRVLAYSQSAAREIVREFGIPEEEVPVVPLGVDLDRFARIEPGDDQMIDRLQLPERYFFSLATDFPHKNLPRLLEAYRCFRASWQDGPCPGLVLAGYSTAARGAFYQQMQCGDVGPGVTFLGAVSASQLRVLYQRSEALLFPSLYEGFGLPPLEAMAAGTVVIAMPISSLPEVGGDSILYPDGFSAEALANAMDRLVRSPELRRQLYESGQRRVREFTWERTARQTVEVYRATVLRPSRRSLVVRRQLWEALLAWSAPETSADSSQRPIEVLTAPGIRIAWQELNGAVQRRVRREVKRLLPAQVRRSA